MKTAQREEVVIAGFTASRRTRPFFGALALAVRENGGWRYIGHVGTGFSHKVLEELHGKLLKLKASKSPFPAKVKDEQVTTLVRPSLVAEVKFAEWTSKGELRHQSISVCGPTKKPRTSFAKRVGRENNAAEKGRGQPELALENVKAKRKDDHASLPQAVILILDLQPEAAAS